VSDGGGAKNQGTGPEAVGEALRTAVERTLAATAESASGTRERAQELLDDVVRRGQSAREEVTRRGESATSRLADAIGELRAVDSEGLRRISERLAAVEQRLDALEGRPAAAAQRTGPEPSPLEPDEDGDLGTSSR
jgi:polyhydroxyalkanoate synthesis regulator phasin